ncbi:G-type lectin S-receptor-like serine/threonine-protein kinase [Tanacetum coccineum]
MATDRGTAVNRLCMTCWYILIISLQHSRATDTLTKDNPIYIGKTLVSANQVFELGFFSPDNSAKQYLGIWFKNITIRKIIWVANRESPLSISDTSSSLTIVDDGNLRILDGERNTVWSTNITLHSNKTAAKLTDTGDFCLNDTISGMILWESFDYPSNSLLQSMKLGTNGKTLGTHLMTSWKSGDDPTPGNFVVGLSEERPPQIFTWNGSKECRRQDPGYSELINLPDGMFQMIYLDEDNKMAWEEPNDPCDVYGVCGAFAICTSNKSPTCDCLKGFVPESNEEWGKSNWTRGCVRRSELLCEKNESSLASGKTNFQAYAFVIGIYCMGWTEDLIDIEQFPFGGEDLYLRLSHSESGRNTMLNHFSLDDEIVSRDALQEEVFPHESLELPIYEFKEIITATDNFSYRNKLGEGGFGPVYKGILDLGQQVAVKRLSCDSGQGIEEFKNEIALISKLQHRNLVKLLDPKKRSQLDWATRFNIIQGIVRGLIYLHRDSFLRIIHRDLKCGNILLDEKMNPKISDFGLARNFQMTQELVNTHRIVGT